MIRPCICALAAGLALGTSLACSAPEALRRAEARSTESVAAGLASVRAARLRDTRRPAHDEQAPATSDPATPPQALDEPLVLSLAQALAIAVDSNRDIAARREDLALDALALADVRHGFAPLIAATLTGLLADGDETPLAREGSATLALTQRLAHGGDLSVGLTTAAAQSASGDDGLDHSTGFSVHLAQPLLRGAGKQVGLEPLVQAERNFLYRIREFELFREELSIDVARRFFALVRSQQAIENQERNLEGVEFGRRQAEALFQVGRTNELDVLRARRSELTSRNSLLEAEESYRQAADEFRIYLGLPLSVLLSVAPEPPEFVPTTYDVASAVEVALANRLDHLNRIEQLADAERAVRLAGDGLRADLDLVLDWGLTAQPNSSFLGQELDREQYSALLRLDLPLDRVREAHSLRRAHILLVRARRDLEEYQDQLGVAIESSFRELTRRELSLAIQRQLIHDQERNVKIANLRFEQGDVSNRDVVEAQESLLEARNALVEEQVAYELARLGLLRALGVLFIDENGMWTE